MALVLADFITLGPVYKRLEVVEYDDEIGLQLVGKKDGDWGSCRLSKGQARALALELLKATEE